MCKAMYLKRQLTVHSETWPIHEFALVASVEAIAVCRPGEALKHRGRVGRVEDRPRHGMRQLAAQSRRRRRWRRWSERNRKRERASGKGVAVPHMVRFRYLLWPDSSPCRSGSDNDIWREIAMVWF